MDVTFVLSTERGLVHVIWTAALVSLTSQSEADQLWLMSSVECALCVQVSESIPRQFAVFRRGK